jgi:hypothetical protein
LVSSDPLFSSVNKELFQKEIKVVQLEMFAFAWSQVLKNDKFTFPQSIFTRQYLDQNELSEYWELMLQYNQVIAASATMDENGQEPSG